MGRIMEGFVSHCKNLRFYCDGEERHWQALSKAVTCYPVDSMGKKERQEAWDKMQVGRGGEEQSDHC